MLPIADQHTINNIKGSADIVEEIDALTTILGFCKPDIEATDEEKKAMPIWSLLKVTESGTIFPILTEMKWGAGLCVFNQVWNDRAAVDYKFRKF